MNLFLAALTAVMLPLQAKAETPANNPFDLYLGTWKIESPLELADFRLEFQSKGSQLTIIQPDGTRIGGGKTSGKRSASQIKSSYKIPSPDLFPGVVSVIGESGQFQTSILSGNDILNGSFTPKGAAFPVPFLATYEKGRVAKFSTSIEKRKQKPLQSNSTATFRIEAEARGPSPSGDGAVTLIAQFNGAGLSFASGKVAKGRNIIEDCRIFGGASANYLEVACDLKAFGPKGPRTYVDIEVTIPDQLAGKTLNIQSSVARKFSASIQSPEVSQNRSKKRFKVEKGKGIVRGCDEENSITVITVINNTDTSVKFERQHSPSGSGAIQFDNFEVAPVSEKTVELNSKFGLNKLVAAPYCNGQPVLVNGQQLVKEFSITETIKEKEPCITRQTYELFDSTFGNGPLVCQQQILPGENIDYDCPLSFTLEGGIVATRLEQGTAHLSDVVEGKREVPYFVYARQMLCFYTWNPTPTSSMTGSLLRFEYAPDAQYFNNNGFPFHCRISTGPGEYADTARQFRVFLSNQLPLSLRQSLGPQLVDTYQNLGASCP